MALYRGAWFGLYGDVTALVGVASRCLALPAWRGRPHRHTATRRVALTSPRRLAAAPPPEGWLVLYTLRHISYILYGLLALLVCYVRCSTGTEEAAVPWLADRSARNPTRNLQLLTRLNVCLVVSPQDCYACAYARRDASGVWYIV